MENVGSRHPSVMGDVLDDAIEYERFMELFLCGLAYVADNEGVRDSTALQVAERLAHEQAERLQAVSDWADGLARVAGA